MKLRGRIAYAIVWVGGTAIAGPAIADGLKDAGPATFVSPKSTVTFSGSEWAKDASYFYSGVIYALNRDLGRDGILLRAYGGVAMYEYDSLSVPGGRVDGDGFQGDAMVGYLWHLGRANFAAYIGVDVQKYDLTPNDPTNDVNGSEVGFKVAADLVSANDSPFYWGLHGSYSTAFNSYWARARVGLNTSRFIIGPEGIVVGNDGFDAQRVGGFVTVRMELNPSLLSEITAYVGHQFVSDDSGPNRGGISGGEGIYGGVGFSLVF